eukprot:1158730-Pelagomonas_calceolata.AAC.6
MPDATTQEGEVGTAAAASEQGKGDSTEAAVGQGQPGKVWDKEAAPIVGGLFMNTAFSPCV